MSIYDFATSLGPGVVESLSNSVPMSRRLARNLPIRHTGKASRGNIRQQDAFFLFIHWLKSPVKLESAGLSIAARTAELIRT